MAEQDSGADGLERPIPAVVVLGPDGTVVGWSKAATGLFGYAPDEILGRGARTLRPEAESSVRIWNWTGATGDPRYRSGIADLRHRDSDLFLAYVESSLINRPGGRHGFVVSAVPAASGGTGLSVLGPLLTRAPVVMAAWDSDLRFVWMNGEAEDLREVFPYFEIGRPLPETSGGDAPIPVELIREVFEGGEQVIDREARWVSRDGTRERAFSTFVFQLLGLDGRPIGVCLTAVESTHSRARERLTLLRQASVEIGTTLDVAQTAQELADLAVPGFADYVTVDLTDLVLPGSEPLGRLGATPGRIPALRRAALSTIHTDIPKGLQPLGQAVYVPPRSPYTQILETGESYIEPVLDTSPTGWISRDADRATVIRGLGMHTGMLVPLKARGNLLGIVLFIRTRNPAMFTRDDLTLAEELVARAALSLDNARQYTRERAAALALQRQLLPRKVAASAAIDVASLYLPSDMHEGVGGDWYDTIELSDSRVALVVGDVTGHGINAAASMGRMRTAVRTLAYLNLPPHELLARLDDLLAREAAEEAGETGDFPMDGVGATCLYAVYDPSTRRCTMATAGHPPPALVAPDGGVTFLNLPTGTPVGLGFSAYESLEIDLAERSLLALYTDGLVETRDSDFSVGLERLAVALTGTEGPLQDLCRTVVETMVGETAEDDVALLMARTRG